MKKKTPKQSTADLEHKSYMASYKRASRQLEACRDELKAITLRQPILITEVARLTKLVTTLAEVTGADMPAALPLGVRVMTPEVPMLSPQPVVKPGRSGGGGALEPPAEMIQEQEPELMSADDKEYE